MLGSVKTIAAGLLVCAAALYVGAASGQDGWVTLVDNGKKGDWNEIGKANWEMKDGILTADKLDGKDLSYLVSKTPYKDFQIYAEFWVDEEANSGIFIRCENPDRIGGNSCYEVNIFDTRPGQEYATGAIVNVAKVIGQPKAANKWNVLEIEARGPTMTVTLNGVKTAEGMDSKHPRGRIALQYGAGTVKFRKVEINPL